MILTGDEIEKQVKSNNIIINPFVFSNLNPNSYNYRIGPEIIEFNEDILDSKFCHKVKKINMRAEGFLLQPERIYLARTYEEIGSEKFVTSLIGRSSMGRLGLYLQITADLGQLGPSHCWTLELKVVQPLVIYPRMKIGQVSFWRTTGLGKIKYSGNYTNHSLPHVSEYFSELKNTRI